MRHIRHRFPEAPPFPLEILPSLPDSDRGWHNHIASTNVQVSMTNLWVTPAIII